MILPGLPVTCSTQRQPSALNVGQTAAMTTYLSSLTVRAPIASGTPVRIVTPGYVADTFGVQVTQPGLVKADWPAGNTDDLPVTPNDILVFPNSNKYVVAASQAVYGQYLTIILEMAVA